MNDNLKRLRAAALSARPAKKDVNYSPDIDKLVQAHQALWMEAIQNEITKAKSRKVTWSRTDVGSAVRISAPRPLRSLDKTACHALAFQGIKYAEELQRALGAPFAARAFCEDSHLYKKSKNGVFYEAKPISKNSITVWW